MSSRYPKPAQIKISTSTFDVEGLFESELGYLMLRLLNVDTKTYITYNLGKYDKRDNLIVNAIRKYESNNYNMLGSGTLDSQTD